jgi:hypothetical protein
MSHGRQQASRMTLPYTAGEWLARASDARTLAGGISDRRPKQIMTEIAVRYERLARYATFQEKRAVLASVRRGRNR